MEQKMPKKRAKNAAGVKGFGLLHRFIVGMLGLEV
jgi:hypothetical protein